VLYTSMLHSFSYRHHSLLLLGEMMQYLDSCGQRVLNGIVTVKYDVVSMAIQLK
jgi:hypothetical protein